MSQTGPGSVTRWIVELKAGGNEAAREIWNRYYNGLTRLARKGLRQTSRGPADEEDVALSAFRCLWQGATSNRFVRLNDRHDLWRLLAVIALQKAVDQERREGRLKRGGPVLVESLLEKAMSEDGGGLEALEARGATPELAAMMVEELQQLLDRLGDDTLREIALSKMDGYTDKEIADRLGCGLRTVERKLSLIRRLWLAAESD
jgi:DNA-directed RNA polymerase specialized sigma24 family protein